MKAIEKLMRIDEERFGGLVTQALSAAYGRANLVEVAYRGLDLRNPGMDRRIVEWIAPLLYDKKSPTAAARLRQWWADAILDRYSVVPNDEQWTKDPLASRLKIAEPTALRAEITQLCADTLKRRTHAK